ncbi:MAG: anaerobic sulfatase maturase [Candidatus Riflebacteria bacterium]|nr:anaerobic sulfatase maturase [Candidatus Riflebacteria bacterium]
MRCDYCYYLDKQRLFPGSPSRMPEALLERYIVQRFEASPGPNIHFEWHGGEPTLLGLDYFRTITSLQHKCNPDGRTVSNGLQTNGILIDSEWADFLAQNGFSVGLSLDGPEEFHDGFRKANDNGPTQSRVVRAFHLLKERRVFCNVLCVLHAKNTAEPDKLYDFFRGLGVSYIQFLPLVGIGNVSAGPEAIGHFLCRIFDRWIKEDVGRMVIQIFDEALRPIYGIPHALCIHRETCGDAAVLEHDGSFYACDHFVDPKHLIGNIQERRLSDLANDPAMARFGKAKRETLPQFCKECDVLSFCNGGCPKDRISNTPTGEGGLNYLCPAYRAFFHHSRPALTRLAAHMKAGKSLRSFM